MIRVRDGMLILLALCATALAQDTPTSIENEDATQSIQQQIRQLASKKFADREAATRALIDAGKPAIPAPPRSRGIHRLGSLAASR